MTVQFNLDVLGRRMINGSHRVGEISAIVLSGRQMRILRVRILGWIVGGSRSAALIYVAHLDAGPSEPRFRSDRSVGFSLRPDPTRKLQTDNDSDWETWGVA